MDPLVILNLITVVLVVFITYISVKLIICLNATYKSGWWTVLPLIFAYALVNRILVLMVTLGVLPDDMTRPITTSMIIFWIGMAVFIYGLYRAVEKVICRM